MRFRSYIYPARTDPRHDGIGERRFPATRPFPTSSEQSFVQVFDAGRRNQERDLDAGRYCKTSLGGRGLPHYSTAFIHSFNWLTQ